ncbi:hypothetical protein HNR46_002250 [Haloferula luteola]|uniref:Uncharacterized protein n=1 Tax=Haloferula luteola TaxID=595692 RepID=A0A840VDV1_9BACT|nr:hypothetical protein [Haloferula luteola]MBB5352009.1 hypothetical protein [Haloferula luteola]
MSSIIPSCESAVSTIPEWHKASVRGHEEFIASHGWSPGALNLAQGIASQVHSPLVHADVSRLLIDLSRHPDSEDRWSEVSRQLTEDQRRKLDERQKSTYLETLHSRIRIPMMRRETTIHLAIDTAPLAEAAVELSCDGRRTDELAWLDRWAAGLRNLLPEGTVRTGTTGSHDLQSFLRDRHPGLLSIRVTAAVGSFLEGRPVKWTDLRKAILSSLPRD